MKQDLEGALQAIVSMISRAEKAQENFMQGTPQNTLLKNRIKALYIASSFIESGLKNNDDAHEYTKEDLENALAPIASLISKSEKVQKKLTQGSWQYTMTENNLKALHIALPLLQRAIRLK